MDVTEVELTDAELALLDGKCSPKVQREVDSAKSRMAMANQTPDIPQSAIRLIQKIVDTAKQDGELTFYYTSIKSCDVCGEKGGYRQYTRSSRYHRKGETDYDHPNYLNGVELKRSFVRMQGYVSVGCCSECFAKYKPAIAEALKNIPAEIPEAIAGIKPLYKKYDNRQCSKCGWTGHEGQMGKSLTLMGDGYYPSTCPQCGAKNELFSNLVKSAEGFTVVPVQGAK